MAAGLCKLWPTLATHCCYALIAFGGATVALAQEEDYPRPPEAEKRQGVPEGKVEGPFKLSSKIYPGTQRDYWIYVPSQYEASKSACTLIVQDGLRRAEDWNLPTICDNLIHSKEMPVTIGIFVTPGVVPPLKEDAQPRFNRSFEYDSLGDRYARFLLEELLPEVAKQYNLSSDPNDRALAGASSGGICAFNAAWERPDAFRRVLSTIGTFVGLRGADQLATLVRKVEPKPLRVFLQDGSNDLDIYAGDWWVANQGMLSALSWAGYDVKHVWGEGGHNSRHSASIMADALRWLWRDYPTPIALKAGAGSERRINIVVPGSGWEQVSSGHEQTSSPACNAAGELFFCDSKAGRIFRVGDDSKTRIFADQIGRITSLAFGPDNHLYACKDGKQIVRFDAQGKEEIVIGDAKADSMVTLPDGFYFSDPISPAIWWCTYEGGMSQALTLPAPVSALTPTPDHAFLHLTSAAEQHTQHCRIRPDGELQHRQAYGHLHMPYHDRSSGARGAVVDSEGRVFVASTVGIQVLDQLGRVNFILTKPSNNSVTGLTFGGARRDTLFVTSGDSVYRRRLSVKGIRTSEAPTVPPKPQL